MTRKEHLEFCKICMNRDFDRQQGIVCKLTGSIANFNIECLDFKKDIEQEAVVLQKKMAATGDHESGDAMDFKKNQTNGAIVFVIGMAILLSTLAVDNLGVIIIPFGIIIYGASVYLRGVQQEKIWKQHHQKKEE